LLVIGCAAVVNRLALFFLEKRGAWIAAASRQIASKLGSHRSDAGHRFSDTSLAAFPSPSGKALPLFWHCRRQKPLQPL